MSDGKRSPFCIWPFLSDTPLNWNFCCLAMTTTRHLCFSYLALFFSVPASSGSRQTSLMAGRRRPSRWERDTPPWPVGSSPFSAAAQVRRHSPSVKKLLAFPAQPPYWNLKHIWFGKSRQNYSSSFTLIHFHLVSTLCTGFLSFLLFVPPSEAAIYVFV
jgi:hypothetical protein